MCGEMGVGEISFMGACDGGMKDCALGKYESIIGLGVEAGRASWDG
jgi:hypothetical protein